jgi:hypothetical protein
MLSAASPFGENSPANRAFEERPVPQSPAPPLTIVIATKEAWPHVRDTLEAVRDQAEAVGAEVILADGHGRALPDDGSCAQVTWIREPGASVFRLRALGITRARGDVIAVTEDHCLPAPDWCETLIRLHRERPDAAVIGGAIENGSTTRIVDWASFLLSSAPAMRPLLSRSYGRIATPGNISYKRRAIPQYVLPTGVLELAVNRTLRARGERLIADDRLVVHHIQSFSLPQACQAHFHNGRSLAGFRKGFVSPTERLLRLGACAVLPGWLLWRSLGALCSKRRALDRALVGLPALVLFAYCHAVGELFGYLAGPGNSPQRIA